MKFTPEKYAIPDEPGRPFIDPEEIRRLLQTADTSPHAIERAIEKALDKQRLSLAETATLIRAETPESRERIHDAAKQLKERIYGNRIVLFAPLYVGNYCVNNCLYCGFRTENREAQRLTLTLEQLDQEVRALVNQGQKRLILVFGEHPQYSPAFIAETTRRVYSIREGHGEIRRVNINAAPLDVEGFAVVKEAGIGTYQIFQETYDPALYEQYHLRGPKQDFNWRLTALDRAQLAGIDDVGIGALLGLGDWQFEVMALVRHTNHLEACFNVGPHTISFPRLQEASGAMQGLCQFVPDADFAHLVAVLRLAVPYTGMILTAREPAHIREAVLSLGVSQIDAGTRLEIGAYAKAASTQELDREQFKLNDARTLDEVVSRLTANHYIPSFCTACYRKGRTGEHFMEFAVPGFIKRYCTPNAILTLAEFLHDYASPTTRESAEQLIAQELATMEEGELKNTVLERLERIAKGERDLYL